MSRTLFFAGRIRRRPGVCGHEAHVGPFRLRPDITAWMQELARSLGRTVGEYGDCAHCASTVEIPALGKAS